MMLILDKAAAGVRLCPATRSEWSRERRMLIADG